jgi:hypothetical protein
VGAAGRDLSEGAGRGFCLATEVVAPTDHAAVRSQPARKNRASRNLGERTRQGRRASSSMALVDTAVRPRAAAVRTHPSIRAVPGIGPRCADHRRSAARQRNQKCQQASARHPGTATVSMLAHRGIVAPSQARRLCLRGVNPVHDVALAFCSTMVSNRTYAS